jgi:uncharacterized lipoprotein YddW (UPF0748 family)
MARTPAAYRVALALLAALACADGEPPEAADVPPVPEAAAPQARGLWVLCEGSQRVLEHPERIPDLIADARWLGVSDLFVQVYRGGRAWYDSSHADATPYRALHEATGGDPLAELITLAHENDLRVHAWVNVLSLARNRQAPILRDLGPGAVLVDRAGRSLLDYPDLDVPPPDRRYYRMGTPAVWLDPAAPGVAERLSLTFAELLARYPELDGLHLDYIRYPDVLPFTPGSRFGVGLDFGYGPATRARFRAETGLEAPFGDSIANANAWDTWRRDQVTALVVALRFAARSIVSDIQLSAAVWSWADRAYLAQGQDWRRWLEDGLIELAVPMAYTLDDRILRYLAESYARLPLGERVWVGLGTWLFARRPERALEQIRIVRAAGAAGDALFSWDSIAEAPALRSALAAEAPDLAAEASEGG